LNGKKQNSIACFGVKALPYPGGIESILEEIAPRLVSKGFDLTIYVRAPYTGKRFEKWEYKGLSIVSIPCIRSKHLEAPTHTILSVVHALFEGHNIFFFNAIVLGVFTIVPRIFGKKVILQTQGLDWKREKWGKLATMFIKFSAFCSVFFANKTICVSEIDADYFLKKYNKSLPIIPNGVNVPRLTKSVSYLHQKNITQKKYLLFMSRLVPEKGCHILLKAWSMLSSVEKSDVVVVIAGSTNYKDDYYNDLINQAADDILFLGFARGLDKEELLTHALAYVQPSTIEGMSIALLEAMSFGLFPIVSDIPENLSVVGTEYGESFWSNNPRDLADKIKKLLSNIEKLIESKDSISSYILSKYKWDDSVNKLTKILHELG